jgi:putative cell wall-binding protein
MAFSRGTAGRARTNNNAGFASATCAPNVGSNCGDLLDHGGPIMPSIASHTIYWDPSGSISPAYRNALNTFFGDIGHDTFYDSALQYDGSNGAPHDAASFAGSWIDTTPYPNARPGTKANPLNDDDIQDAIVRALTANPSSGPANLATGYHVLLPKDVYVKLGQSFESFVDFCAYHSAFVSGSNLVIYSTLPYAGTNLGGCGTGGIPPSGSADIDSTTSLASHELMEMVTDPLGNAWFDQYGNENGDLCLFVFGPRAADGGNVTLNGHRYLLQLEWSNADDTSPPDYHAACAGGATAVRRIAGPDRIDTAVLASRDVWAPVGSSGPHAATAVIARSDDYADALAGVPLAGAEGGPLLLTPSSALDSRVAAEIQRILPAGTNVYVLGGTSALSPSVVASLQQRGYQVTRLAGANRYATAVSIASDGLHDPTTVLLATGTDFADALAAGAAAAHAHAAVLLTTGSTMPTATVDYLSNHSSTRYAIGGPAAAAAPSATAIVGTDRYDTSKRVATTFFGSVTAADVATGFAFPDALGGGAHAAARDIPMLLTNPSTLPDTVASYLQNHHTTIASVVVFGGTAAVSDSVLSNIRAALA